jgi:hypothetical protein
MNIRKMGSDTLPARKQGRRLARVLLGVGLAMVMFFSSVLAAMPVVTAQGPGLNAVSSRVANPASHMPLDASIARVTYTAPVFASTDAIQANRPFTRHGSGTTWVSVYRSTTVGGRSYHWVGWDWNTYGWIPSDSLSFSPTLSQLRGVDLRARPGERLAMVYSSTLNVRGTPGDFSAANWVGGLRAWDVVSIQEERWISGTPWYRIGDGQWIHGGFVRPFSISTRPSGVGANEKWIDVNLTNQTVIAYEGDTPVFATLTATGARGFETVTGLYRIYVKHRTAPMRSPYGDRRPYNYADVPYIMYFHRGYGLHGSYWHDLYGSVQSAGCVNLSPHDSQWLFNWAGPVLPSGARTVNSSANNPGTAVWVHY